MRLRESLSMFDCIAYVSTPGPFPGLVVRTLYGQWAGPSQLWKGSLASVAASSWGCLTCLFPFKPQFLSGHLALPKVGHIQISRG